MTAILIGKMTIGALEYVNNNPRSIAMPVALTLPFLRCHLIKGHKGFISRKGVNQPCERV